MWETNVSLRSGLDSSFRKSAIGLDATGNYLIYGGMGVHPLTNQLFVNSIKGYGTDYLIYGKPEGYGEPRNYGAMSLTPWYRLNLDHFRMKLGIRTDWTFNKDVAMDHSLWVFITLAPVAEFDYNIGKFGIFLHLLGGRTLTTLASQYESDYYCTPGLVDTTPLYRPVDGDFGIRLGSFGGFEATADIAFRASLNERIGGWYTAMLSPTAPTSRMFGGAYTGSLPSLTEMSFDNLAHLYGFSVGLRLAYDTGSIFRISAEGRYQPQDGEYGYFNGFDRPRWTLRAEAESNPWKRLKFKLGLDWRGDRAIYAKTYTEDYVPTSDRLVAYALPDLISLDFGASYGVTDRIAVWAQADNLLNRRNILLPGCPTPGISLSAGVSVGF